MIIKHVFLCLSLFGHNTEIILGETDRHSIPLDTVFEQEEIGDLTRMTENYVQGLRSNCLSNFKTGSEVRKISETQVVLFDNEGMLDWTRCWLNVYSREPI